MCVFLEDEKEGTTQKSSVTTAAENIGPIGTEIGMACPLRKEAAQIPQG